LLFTLSKVNFTMLSGVRFTSNLVTTTVLLFFATAEK
jgi:hypothetical protein